MIAAQGTFADLLMVNFSGNALNREILQEPTKDGALTVGRSPILPNRAFCLLQRHVAQGGEQGILVVV